MATVTITLTTAGTYTWVSPSDVTSVQVEAWGAGGNGGGRTAAGGGGGGGGGAYALTPNVTVTGSTSYTIVVGAPSAVGTGNGGNGANSTFASTTVVAAGGSGGGGGLGASESGGAGGTTGSSTGTTKNAGGVGGATTIATDGGGGGGESGGSTTTGNAGGAGGVGTGGAGGVGANTNSGAGANGTGVSQGVGGTGNAPGGGGGGSYSTASNENGGQGAPGQVKLTFTTNDVALTQYGGVTGSSVSSITQSVVIDNNNSTLVVFPKAYDGTTAANTDISSVKYNGVSLTQLQHYAVGDGGHASQFANVSFYLYAITGLPAGTHNLVVTWAGAAGSPQFGYEVFANSAAAIDNSNINEFGSVSTYTGSITTVSNNALVSSGITFDNQGSVVTSAGQQQIYNTGFDAVSMSKVAKTPAGSVTHTYTNGTPDYYVITMVSIAPYVIPSVSSGSTLLMMGVG